MIQTDYKLPTSRLTLPPGQPGVFYIEKEGETTQLI